MQLFIFPAPRHSPTRETTNAIPTKGRSERWLVARMMLAGRERKSSLRRGRLLLEAAAALLHEARRMDEAQRRGSQLAPKPVPAKVIQLIDPRGACQKIERAGSATARGVSF